METPLLTTIITASVSIIVISITISYQLWIEKRKWALSQDVESKKEIRVQARIVLADIIRFLVMLDRYIRLIEIDIETEIHPDEQDEARKYKQEISEKTFEHEIKLQTSLAELAILSPKVYESFKSIENEIHSITGKLRNDQITHRDINNLQLLLREVPNKAAWIKEIQPVDFTKALELFNKKKS